ACCRGRRTLLRGGRRADHGRDRRPDLAGHPLPLRRYGRRADGPAHRQVCAHARLPGGARLGHCLLTPKGSTPEARTPAIYSPNFDDLLPAAGGRLISGTTRQADVTETTETETTSTKTETGGRNRIERYDATSIEPRWQKRWEELGLHRTDLHDTSRPKFYLLTMYPYPSGDIHIGHWYIITPTDAIARFHRMHGENVYLPIGFDAFGLPAENAALTNKINPRAWTMSNIDNMRRQLRTMGATFDWDAEVVTADPDYYRWNQWFFLQFLKAGLAYRAKSLVDWCPNDGTLAREQVEGADRHCWRCGAKVEKRDLAQWYLKVTNYADELLD